MFRRRGTRLEVLLGHPGGPYWQKKHEGAWTIPKGEIDEGESALDAAVREFQEETGMAPCGPYSALGQITQRSGKVVEAWAFEGDCDPASLTSVTTTIEWPPRSARVIEIPEIDRSEFFDLDDARVVINPAQVPLLDRLEELVRGK